MQIASQSISHLLMSERAVPHRAEVDRGDRLAQMCHARSGLHLNSPTIASAPTLYLPDSDLERAFAEKCCEDLPIATPAFGWQPVSSNGAVSPSDWSAG